MVQYGLNFVKTIPKKPPKMDGLNLKIRKFENLKIKSSPAPPSPPPDHPT